MITYEYICPACTTPFEVRASVSEYNKGLKPACPHCGSKQTIRDFSNVGIMSNSSKGSESAAGCGAGPCCCG